MADPATIDYTRLPSRKRMLRDTAWNLIGMGFPILAGAIAFPVMLNETIGFGKERVELIGLVWMLVGFSSIFDMGLGRALTKRFADKLSRGQDSELPGLFWTALLMTVSLGLVAGAIVLAIIPLMTRGLDAVLRREAVYGFITVACAMPIVITNVGLAGVLQACRRFKLLNLIRIPAGSLTFLAPLCVLPFTRSIWPAVIALAAVRVTAMFGYFIACLRIVPSLRCRVAWERRELGGLLGFGGWMTVSNMGVSLMTHVNRFIIRSVRKIGEGAYYLVPEEMVVRLLIVPRALIDVLFPAFVTGFNSKDEDPTEVFDWGVTLLTLVMTPVILLVAIVAHDVFAIWLPDPPDFAERTSLVMLLLTLGVFIHGIARVVWYYLQAAGRPDLSARLHVIEVLLYMGAASLLIIHYGIEGAAMAWTGRVVFDFAALSILAARFLTRPWAILGKMWLHLGLAVGLVLLAVMPDSLLLRLAVGSGGLAVFYAVSWQWILTGKERIMLVAEIRKQWARLRPGRGGGSA